MIGAYEDLTPAALTPLGFDHPAHACHILQNMAGHNVPDSTYNAMLKTVTEALTGCADPDRAVANLGRFADASGNRLSAYQQIAASPITTRMMIAIFAVSQFFSDLLIRTPEYLEVLTNPRIRDRNRSQESLWEDLQRRVAIAKTPNAKRDALRRFKPPEVLRIGARDILGYADMAATAVAISDFADVSIQMALEIAAGEQNIADPDFAVIAMGKLGGQELNYSSDIDLVFIHGDTVSGFNPIKLAESVRDTLARATDAGFVFRVDLRLRPEGRFGPVSRSLESCRAYYESWAEPWERQALMKARFVAGNAQLGADFILMAEEFVYRPRVEESFVESIRQNKHRLEQKIAQTGEAGRNVKEGFGGIRDVEFAVQLMQLIAGGAHPELRTGNTLTALTRLAGHGMLSAEEAGFLRESYIFLRNVEHRLQIMDELPVRCIPSSQSELDKFGRRLGYPDGKLFLQEYQRTTSRVNALFKRLFYADSEVDFAASLEQDISQEIIEWTLAPDDPAAQLALRNVLTDYGFRDIDSALEILRRNVVGSDYGDITPEARRTFAALTPNLLQAAGAANDPNAALQGLESLARAVPSSAALYKTLLESPEFLGRLCLLAEAPPLWQILLQHQEFFDLLADDELMELETLSPQALAETPQALAVVLMRRRLHTGARDVWGLANTSQTMHAITRNASYALNRALAIARKDVPDAGAFAIIGMGKLGGGELGYASDFDLLYVSEAGRVTQATKLAERLQHILKDDMARYGIRFELDARLRPDGRKGNLVQEIDGYRTYYATSAATWERQALIKARPVAGDAALGQAFAAVATEVVYGQTITSEQIEEVRHMKHRIETERLKNPNDLKLAPGGMADIEWTTQILQWQAGQKRARSRIPNTLNALRVLRDDALITQADWETLSQCYLQLTQLRNHLYLKFGVATDAPETLPQDLKARMASTRAICLRLFYGEQ